ncbi:MAG: choice-of-anchor J domain-containing protein, partial [Bacteroidetes bacterium]|nr:choice-of-anchor J domain-containing protein [Bacteroidota bacterium]
RDSFKHDPAALKAYLEGDWDAFSATEDSVFKPNWFNACRLLEPDYDLDLDIKVIACDIATKRGENETVIVKRCGNVILSIDRYKHISTTQTAQHIKIMNEDFNKMNADTSEVVAPFDTNIADVKVEFRLAQIDPDGNCTNGITRYNSGIVCDENDCQGVKNGSIHYGEGDRIKIKVNAFWTNRWDNSMYLNIYSVRYRGGSGAYAYYPNQDEFSPKFSGIEAGYRYFGTGGNAWGGGDERTISHEAGHFFSLDHIWGSSNDPNQPGNCDSTPKNDDGVADTPNCKGTYGCNLARNSCDTGLVGDLIDNVQNFMEYSTCYRMFTNGQKDKMRAALASSIGDRNNLGTLSNLIATGTSNPYVYGSSSCQIKAKFGIDRSFICEGEDVTYYDYSWNNIRDSVVWSFPGGTPSNSTDTIVTVTYSTPGVYDVILTAYSGGIADVDSSISKIQVNDLSAGLAPPFIEDFESASAFKSRWYTINNEMDTRKWLHDTSHAFSGTSCVKMYNKGGRDKYKDELISPFFDFSAWSGTEGGFCFYLAHAQRKSKNDRLQILISKDCGQNWVSIYDKQGADWHQMTRINPI